MIIRKIEAKPKRTTFRVAAYARVSTNKEQQEESFETQKTAYQKLIEETEGWEFAGIYADKARTGTKVKNRPGFQQMITDAEQGKLDIILVKNIARFSRNVGNCQEYVDRLKARFSRNVGNCQEYVDRLKANNVTVIFEKENIRTDDPTSNFQLALLGAISQDESNSIGLNRRWAYQQRFANGDYNIGSNRILGYDGVDGKLVPNQGWCRIRMPGSSGRFSRGMLPGRAIPASAEHCLRKERRPYAVGSSLLRRFATF